MKVKIVALILLTFFLSCSKEKTEIKIPDKLIGLWTYYKGFTGYGIKIDKNGSYTHNYYSLKFLKFEGFDAKIIKATDDEIHFKIKDKTYIHKYRIEEGRLYVANSPAELLKVIKNREQEYTKLTAQPSVSLNLEGLYGTYSSANEESLNTVFITIAKNGDFRVSLHYKQSNKIAKVSGKVIGFKRIKNGCYAWGINYPDLFCPKPRG